MLMGASLGLAGLAGCSPAPAERIMPYVRAPEDIVPGRPLYFATAMPLAGYATGVLVESYMGRPTKVEGNPAHPSNPKSDNQPEHARFGPSDMYAQASVLTLYDPDRSQAVMAASLGVASWDTFQQTIRGRLPRPGSEAAQRLRLRVLTGTVTSPTLAWQLRTLLSQFPQARWHVHEPAVGDNARLGAHHAYGEYVETQYHFDRADVVLSLDADFLTCGPDHLRYVRDFVSRRRVRRPRHGQPPPTMNRLYVVESTPTATGSYADHRLPLRPSQIENFARELLGVHPPAGRPVSPAHSVPPEWKAALLADLNAHRGGSIILAGDGQPPIVHALCHALNQHFGNVGRTVTYTAAVEAQPQNQAESLNDLLRALDQDQVDVLLILGCNPAYTAPVDLRFTVRMRAAHLSIHLGLYQDETAEMCHWHIPEAHYLEAWGDVRARDGTASIIQPLIAPLYHGRTAHEVLGLFLEESDRTSYEIVRGYWEGVYGATASLREAARPVLGGAAGGDFETWWRRALHDGLIAAPAYEARNVTLRDNWTAAPGVTLRGPRRVPPSEAPQVSMTGGAARQAAQVLPSRENESLEIVFRPDPTIFDGRFANNGWLQELPKPITKLTWDNVAAISPATAVRLGLAPEGRPELANEQVVHLEYQGYSIPAPLMVIPGQPNDCITITLGYGRWRAGRVGGTADHPVGFNAYQLRTAAALWFDTGLLLRTTGRRYPLSNAQKHHLIPHGREGILHRGTLDQYEELAAPRGHRPRQTLTLYPEIEYSGNRWGMAIDLTACTGCNACVIACQAENNIPVVGKDQVSRGREMHWLRVDSYFFGSSENPETYSQPVPCMHCENAPCELVCPVAATVHSEDGLNDMVYNRCVGTRYCSNNCPYKVRRFNFLQYSDFTPSSLSLQRNPEVTVRSRGVMEKCTYCVQRIRNAQIDAEVENRRLRDGEIMTACQSACPAGAIIFGDLNENGRQGRPRAQVAQLEAEPLNYGVLAELNTRPRTTYLAALKNPNPALRGPEHRS
jgi:molybdopterin-containing oxidoreductase family iron-sulfur binding subunit